MKTNKNGVKLLAAVMAFAMVLVAGFVVIGGEDSSVDAAANDNIKYFSGTLDGQNEVPSGTIAYIDKDTKIITDGTKVGNIIVRSGGYLKIDSGVTLTIKNAASSLTTSDGTSGTSGDYVGKIAGTTLAGLIVESGAHVIVDGNIVVDKDGSINNSAVYATAAADGSNVILGTSPGFYVNGTITVEKEGKISSASALADINADSNQMIISSAGKIAFKSSTATGSLVEKQTFSIMAGGVLDLDAKIDNTVRISSFSKNATTFTSAVVLGNEKNINKIESGFAWVKTGTSTEPGKVDLMFTVSSEKAGTIWANGQASSRYTVAALDVSGTVYDDAVLVTLDNRASNVLQYDAVNDTSSNYYVYGKTVISDKLTIGKGAYFATVGCSNVIISGDLKIDGTKDNHATVVMAGIHTVSGTVEIGEVNPAKDDGGPKWDTTSTTATTNLYINKAGCFIIIDGDGEVTIDTYDPSSFFGSYTQMPQGTLGVTYIDSDEIFHVTSLAKALAGDNQGEITINGIGAAESVMPKKKFVIASDVTIPEDVEVTIIEIMLIKDGVNFIVSEGAELHSIGGNYGVIEVEGYYYDYNAGNATPYTTPVKDSGNLYVKAEVKSQDADETYSLYTSLKNAMTGAADGTVITLFGDVTVKENMTIPAEVTIKTDSKKIIVSKEKELTVDGVIEIQASGKVVLLFETNKETTTIGKLTVNNMIVDGSSTQIVKGTDASTASDAGYVPGIYAQGEIGDYDNNNYFILAPAVAAENSKTLGSMEIKAKTSYAGDLVFTADKETSGTYTITLKAETVFGKVTIDGYTIKTDNTTASSLTATVFAQTTGGESSVKFNKVSTKDLSISVVEVTSGDDDLTRLTITPSDTQDNQILAGTLTVDSGVVYLAKTLKVGTLTTEKAIMTVSEGAELVIPENVTLDIVNKTLGNVKDYAGLVVDGKLTIDEGELTASNTATAGMAIVNGELSISKKNQTFAGVLKINGTLDIATEGTDKAKLTVTGKMIIGDAPETLGASPVISGAVNLGASAGSYIIAYPGADLSAALIDVNTAGESNAKKTDYFINDSIYMTSYARAGTTFGAIIPATIKITGYENVLFDTANDTPAVTSVWYTSADMDGAKLNKNNTVDDYSAVYAKATPSEVYLKASIGTGISLWIDGVKQTSGEAFKLNVGEYNVEVTINPGYKGTAKIMFNGAEITNGKLVVTPEMSKTSTENTPVVISATGDIAIDNGSSSGSSSSDDGMGITDILLIVLVVLAAILVVIVALRMMRS